MYLPLTTAIFRGVLSPSSLGRLHGHSERLLQATRVLACASGGPAAGVAEALAGLQLSLPLTFPDDFPQRGFFSDLHARRVLCRLRTCEMEYELRISYDEPLPAVPAAFYEALLRAESRWLKRELAERVGQACSDHDARLLLCRVLDEVYDTGARVDDARRSGYQPGLCGLLKGAMASLYLELTVEFGHLLEAMDYLDYSHLLRDARYLHPLCEGEQREYDILQTGNEVKRLLCDRVTEASEPEALRLYDKLGSLHAAFNAPSSAGDGLWLGVSVVESFLFFRFSGIRLREEELYVLFSDPLWTESMLEEIYREHYSGHLHLREGRSASDWIDRKLKEHCFSFLKPEVDCRGSIPRRLCGHLRHQRELYERNFARSFGPAVPGKPFPVAPLPWGAPHLPDEKEVHDMFSFLCVDDGKGERLMSPEHAKLLEQNFCSFLRDGQTYTACHHQIKILKGYAEVLYGLFFHYQQLHAGSKDDYAAFIATMLQADVQCENLKKNSSRYVKTYLDFVKKLRSSLGC